ncbi:MAG TPA: TonB-dependent receptor [Steroidobacteraceae bacterium]|nr:TonB-dependent receptor [Steroidobacteraceae bacterium]
MPPALAIGLGLGAATCAVWTAMAADDLATGAADELSAVVIVGERLGGPDLSDTGAADYRVRAQDMAGLPNGNQSAITEVLTQLPGVAVDQNQQIHIRDTEGPQFQYQINGWLVPLDINTNPPFLSMLNTMFIQQLDLRVGVLPARYGLATGGVVDVQSKNGCQAQGGEFSLEAGQRSTLSPSIEYAACDGALSSYVSARQTWSNTAFSSATPGPTPIHDEGSTPQALGFWSYSLSAQTQLTLLLAATRSDDELPDAPGLARAYSLAGITSVPSSAQIDSHLNFRDRLAMAGIHSTTDSGLELQLGYTAHFISQQFLPDPVGELIYQGVASQALHEDADQTLQADLRWHGGDHTLAAGVYVGDYHVQNSVDSRVFPADAAGAQTSSVALARRTGSSASNVISSLYVSDLWRLAPALSLDLGLRGDNLTGYTRAEQFSPRLNLLIRPDEVMAFHLGAARYLQVPSFLGIAPTTPAAFAGTTAQGPPGVTLPLAEDDYELDAGVLLHPSAQLTLALDNYYEWTRHYLDTGQFGVVPIFAPFNYDHGYLWGSELSARVAVPGLSAYASLTLGENWQRGVATGQFNFNPDELAYIDSHAILLDHQPKFGGAAGFSLTRRPYALLLDAIYSSGLAAGFADTQTLPQTLQINAGAERTWALSDGLPLSLRFTVLNVLDRINEIRSAEGIGIFQAAFGPRRTLLGTVSVRF